MNPTFAINFDNNYPYVTKAQIKERLSQDADFRVAALLVLYRRQTEDERDEKDTKYKNGCGFMSSHAAWGTLIAEKVILSEELSEEEQVKMDTIVGCYTKQLTAHFRAEQVASTQIREEFGV